MDLNEARKALVACLDESTKKEYISLLRKWILLGSSTTKEQFDKSARELLTTDEQVRHHNFLLLAIVSKLNPNRQITDGSAFENADYQDYIQQSNLESMSPNQVENRSAAAELFMPDSGFMTCRIAIVSWENDMDGADKGVTELLVHACQSFVKNIITAMISKKKGYRIRDRKFQYGFNLPVLDPFKRNSSILEHVQGFSEVLDKKEAKFQNLLQKVKDEPFDSTVDEQTHITTDYVKRELDSNEPKFKKLRKNNESPRHKQNFCSTEQQAAFSCAKSKKHDNLLTTALLYETLRENPKILGLHGIQSVNMLKLGLQLED